MRLIRSALLLLALLVVTDTVAHAAALALADGGTSDTASVVTAAVVQDALHRNPTAERLVEAMGLSILFKLLLDAFTSVKNPRPKLKPYLPIIATLLGAGAGVADYVLRGSSWTDAVVLAGSGLGAVVANELANMIRRALSADSEAEPAPPTPPSGPGPGAAARPFLILPFAVAGMLMLSSCQTIGPAICGAGKVLVPPDAKACTAAVLAAAGSVVRDVAACSVSFTSGACIDSLIATGANLIPCEPTCQAAPSANTRSVGAERHRVGAAVLRTNVIESLRVSGYPEAGK